MQADLNLVMPTALAFAALLALVLAVAAHNASPNSGLLLLPEAAHFGSSIS